MTDKLILLIDREDSVREILSICFHYLGGWEVIAVATPTEGADVSREKQPDAIVLDLAIDRVEGLSFIRSLKNNSLTGSIPILLITAYASWFSARHLHSIGVVGALEKPFNPITLPARMAEIFGWPIETTGPHQRVAATGERSVRK
jgi:CheY-like chemotaxis protein